MKNQKIVSKIYLFSLNESSLHTFDVCLAGDHSTPGFQVFWVAIFVAQLLVMLTQLVRSKTYTPVKFLSEQNRKRILVCQ